MPEFYRFRPEARFGHYLMMIGALGEGDCRATSRQYGEYENSIGTGQVHLWFDRPEGGFPRPGGHPRTPTSSARTPAPTSPRPADSQDSAPDRRNAMTIRETRRILLDGNAVDVVRHGDTLVADDGREVGVDEAIHLPPVVPSKIVCVHLNYSSRVEEMMTRCRRRRRTSTSRSRRSTPTRPPWCGPRVASG